MLISYKKQFIFVHNYKVAGSSITKALGKYGLKNPPKNKKWKILGYCPLIHYIDFSKIPFLNTFKSHNKAKEIRCVLNKNDYKEYYKFGFVRNPWDWQVSLYHFMKQNKHHHQHNLIQKMTFDEYIEWRVKDDLHLQKEFFYENDTCIVDFIGKIENIEDDFQLICNKIGVKEKLPHSNKSKRNKDYRKYYNQHTKDLISRYFKEDIELFKYRF
jgi:hypothetical protein